MSDPTPGTDFGARLRRAREARGITLRQIATSTKISLVSLEGLERNDISKLPGGIFSRAFVRSYAQEVGLDPDATIREFLAAFDDEGIAAGTPPALLARKTDAEESTFESRQRVASTVLKLVLVSLPLGVLLLYVSTRGGPAEAPAVVPAPPAATERRSPAPTPAAEVEPGPVTEAPVQAVGDRARATSVPVPQAAVRERAAEPAPEPPPADGSIQVEVAPTGSCWVSLTVDGTLVIARVMESGERVSRRVSTEAVVQVGDAGVFAFSVNGRPGRSLGGSGQVRTLRITPATYEAWLR